MEESQGQLEAEIRKLLQEVTRVATMALEHARSASSHGARAVEQKLQRISEMEQETRALLDLKGP